MYCFKITALFLCLIIPTNNIVQLSFKAVCLIYILKWTHSFLVQHRSFHKPLKINTNPKYDLQDTMGKSAYGSSYKEIRDRCLWDRNCGP